MRRNLIVWEYLVLVGVLLLGAVFYQANRYHPLREFYVVLAVGAAYVLWGTLHHLARGRLSLYIFLEYLLLAALVVGLFLFTLNIV